MFNPVEQFLALSEMGGGNHQKLGGSLLGDYGEYYWVQDMR